MNVGNLEPGTLPYSKEHRLDGLYWELTASCPCCRPSRYHRRSGCTQLRRSSSHTGRKLGCSGSHATCPRTGIGQNESYKTSVNSLAPGRFELNFRYVIFQLISVTDDWGISCKIASIWRPLHLTDDKSTLVQVMACFRQATSHYLSQCWPRFMSPYGVTRPQWVKWRLSLKPFQQNFINTSWGILCNTSRFDNWVAFWLINVVKIIYVFSPRDRFKVKWSMCWKDIAQKCVRS